MNLYDSVMKGASTRRIGDLNLVNFGMGKGTLLAYAQEFTSARQWATQKQSSGNDARDLEQLLSRLEVYVARHGSGIAAKGRVQTLVKLARAMQTLGFNHEDWAFPSKVADELRKKPAQSPAPDNTARAGGSDDST